MQFGDVRLANAYVAFFLRCHRPSLVVYFAQRRDIDGGLEMPPRYNRVAKVPARIFNNGRGFAVEVAIRVRRGILVSETRK